MDFCPPLKHWGRIVSQDRRYKVAPVLQTSTANHHCIVFEITALTRKEELKKEQMRCVPVLFLTLALYKLHM